MYIDFSRVTVFANFGIHDKSNRQDIKQFTIEEQAGELTHTTINITYAPDAINRYAYMLK